MGKRNRNQPVANECSDEADSVVERIEAVIQRRGALSYAPGGMPCLTWRAWQDIGIIIDKAWRAPSPVSGRER